MPEWPWTSVRRTVLAFGAGVGNGLALLRISPAEQSQERHGKKRRAPVSRAGGTALPDRARVARFPRRSNHDGHRQRAPRKSAKAGAASEHRTRAEARRGQSGLGPGLAISPEFEEISGKNPGAGRDAGCRKPALPEKRRLRRGNRPGRKSKSPAPGPMVNKVLIPHRRQMG